MNFKIKFIFREVNLFSWVSFRFVLAVGIGVGTVTGINSYKNNLTSLINNESRNLLGGDLQIESSSKLTQKDWEFAKKILPEGTEKKLMVIFASMLSNQKGSESVLSTVKAMEKGYPFYGEVLTEPSYAYSQLTLDEILLEKRLALNLKVKIGEKIRLGNKLFKVSGYILREPANVASFLGMAPSSIILDAALSQTGLEQRGSRIRYYFLLKIPDSYNSKAIKETKFRELIEKDLLLYHHTEIGSGTQKFIQTTYDYMSLLGLCAFFLGAVSILLFTRSRMESRTNEIAVIKCLGAKSSFYATIFVSEIIFLSIVGSILGLFIGYYFQFWIPDLTGSEFLSQIQPKLDLKSLVWGLLVGILIPCFLVLESIYKISKLSPLVAIRKTHVQVISKFHISLTSYLQIISIYLIFACLGYWETKSFFKAIVLSAILLFLPILIFIFYTLFRNLARKLQEKNIFYGNFKLVLAKISRKGSGLSLPIVGIGSAISILLLTLIIKESLISLSGWNLKEKRANVFVLDLQKDQVSYLRELQNQYHAQISLISPVIGARLLKINGREIEKKQTEMDSLRRDWRSTARTREYFLSYREELYPTEKVVSGKFWEKENISQISVEHEFAKALGVKVGDKLTFNVQGVEIEGKITNTRYVNWADMRPNFVVLFNSYALSKAPGYFLSSFYIEDSNSRYELQKKLVKKYPNAVVIDIEKTIQSVGGIITKVSDIINLITYFIFTSAILLLFSALGMKQKERITEISFYKIVGANSKFLRKNYIYEAFIVSFFAFISALVLSLLANFIISDYLLNLRYELPLTNIFLIYLFSSFTIVILYVLSIQNTIHIKPKEFLRSLE
jgi:predicted lysophospholipase L1 biosynthesis ABC-type transport system permease subunit